MECSGKDDAQIVELVGSKVYDWKDKKVGVDILVEELPLVDNKKLETSPL